MRISDWSSDVCSSDLFQVLPNIRVNGLNSAGAFLFKGSAGIADEPRRMQEIVDHYRFKNIQFEMPGGSAYINGHVIAHYLGRHHCKGFALRGVYFAWHNG